jgi:hypothetical protein
MKSLTIMILLTLSLNANANETVEQCYYGLYDQDTNALIIESDSKEYLESIEHEYDETTLIEISYCEGV